MSTNVGEIDLSLVLNSDKFKSELNNVNKQADSASTKLSSTLGKIGKAVVAAFSVAAVVNFGKECLKVATETSNAWIGLNSILTGQGKSFNNAKTFIEEYVADGLVPLNNAVTAYKNLTLRGYNEDQIKKTMTALKNSATFARQSTYSLGDAVSLATEGLKNENSVVVDNAGVTKNVAKMWEDYAKSIGKTTNDLTQSEKIQAEVNGILEETKFQSNDAAIYANTYSGKVAQLNTAFTNMKTAIGNAVQPIAKLFVPIITTAVNVVTKLFTSLSGLLSLFGLKADSVETVSSGIGDLTQNANNASDAVSGIGDSAKKAGKDARKASNNLASFDKLNVLPKDTDSSAGSGSGNSGSASAGGMTDKLDVSSTITQDTSALDGFMGKLKELADIFKAGFDISFGNVNFDGILKHINGVKDNLINIWTDPDVLNSAKQWVDTCLYSLGQVTGSIARIGINLVEGFVGSIDKYLSQNVDRIKSFICKMFDISSDSMALTGNLWQALGEISDVFAGDTAKQIGADIIAMFANPLMSAIELISKFALDLKAIFVQPIIDNVELIKTTFENILVPIQTVTGTLAEAFTYVGDKWNEIYDAHIHPLMEAIKTGLSDTFGKFLEVYNTYVVPFLTNAANKFNELWNNNLKPFVDKVGEFVGSIADAITALWNNVLKPVVDWIIQNVIPILVPIIEGIWNTLMTVCGFIADAIGGVIDIFKGLIDFVVGIFTGDWNKAWEGIKSFFGGIWETIKGIVQGVWSAICGIVETAINIVKGVIQTVFNAISGIISAIWNTIKNVITTIWTGISTAISNVINGIKNTISNVFNAIKNTISNVFNTVKNTISNIWNGIKTTISNVINGIKTTISKVFNGIKNTLGNIFKGIKNTVSNIWNGIKTTISNVINGIKSTLSKILNSIKSTWNNIWKGIKTTVTNIWNGIWNAIKSVINKILRGIEGFVNGVIKGINFVLGGISSVANAVGSLIGLNPINLKLSEISLPRLAEGGFVKANTPQLAVIGDNKTQGEVVAPEDKMLEMVLTALKMFREQDNLQNNNLQPQNITINFDGTLAQLIRVLKPELDRESKRKGNKLIVGGAT